MNTFVQQKWKKFRQNKRAFYSLWIFGFIFFISCGAHFLCNDRPILVFYKKHFFFPIVSYYPETDFGGTMDIEPNYLSPEFKEELKKENGWAIWPLIPYNYNTVNIHLHCPAPSPPTWENLLGTDDQGRDVLTRLLYGLRVSLLFGLALAFCSSLLGVTAGAVQGYCGGWVDLISQRFIEIWSGLPLLFLLMIFNSLFQPTLLWLFGIMVLFNWTSLVGLVRAEFLRARQHTYVKAAQILGVGAPMIIVRHILPNVMSSTLSYFPFLVSHSISTLTALDFLGVGLPAGVPSLGELLQQAKANLYAPWLGGTAFLGLSLVLSLVTFIGEGLRDALDPHGSPFS